MTYEVKEPKGHKVLDFALFTLITACVLLLNWITVRYLVVKSFIEVLICIGIYIVFIAFMGYYIHYSLTSLRLKVTVNDKDGTMSIRRAFGASEMMYIRDIEVWYKDKIRLISRNEFEEDCITIIYNYKKVKIPDRFDGSEKLKMSLQRFAGHKAQGKPVED